MDKKVQKRLEKFLLAVLGKNPDRFGLVLEEGGWINMKDLHKVLMAEPGFPSLTPKSLKQFLALYVPEKFECNDRKVRARPQLQNAGLATFEPCEPPEILYVAVRPRAHIRVHDQGLHAEGHRRNIVLSPDRDLAVSIGKRKEAEPVIVEVMAGRASRQGGIVFLKAGDLLYLTQELHPRWLNVPPLPKLRQPKDSLKEKPQSAPGKKGGKAPGTKRGRSAPSPDRIGGFVPRPSPVHAPEEEKTSGPEEKKAKRRKRDPEWKKTQRRTRRR